MKHIKITKCSYCSYCEDKIETGPPEYFCKKLNRFKMNKELPPPGDCPLENWKEQDRLVDTASDLVGYIRAVQRQNTHEYMIDLAGYINKLQSALGLDTEFEYDGKNYIKRKQRPQKPDAQKGEGL